MFATATFLHRSSGTAGRTWFGGASLHDRDWVYMHADGIQFRRIAVELAAQVKDDKQQIIRGLKAGDQVVTNALLFSIAAEE